ncbi:hypothetical protein J6590_060631 [Homalodisca vitripennis]|nr:hypothetical protein J6590_060631 [Homalodisca vitripennis]
MGDRYGTGRQYRHFLMTADSNNLEWETDMGREGNIDISLVTADNKNYDRTDNPVSVISVTFQSTCEVQNTV